MKIFGRTLGITLFVSAIAVLMAPALTTTAAAEYPTKPITILVPYGAGGATDVTTRMIAEIASEKLGVQITVENKPGAGGALMTGMLASAEPDGYTLGAITASPVLVRPHVSEVAYDPATDLTYIARYLIAPAPISVRKDSDFESFEDIVAYARENPRGLRWSAVTALGTNHITINAAFGKEGVEATHIPFDSGAEAMGALLGGHIDMLSASDYAGALAADEIRLIVETGPDELPTAPDLPTVKDLGYPLSPSIFYGFGGPAGLPEEVVTTWDDVIRAATEDQRFLNLLDRLKMIPAYVGSEEFSEAVVSDHRNIGEALEDMDM